MKKIRNFLIVFVAIGYIIFEKFFWDKLAVPVIKYLKEKDFYHIIEQKIISSNRYIILFVFITFFSVSELMGIYALAMFAKGAIIVGVILYVTKLIPVLVAFSILDKAKDTLYTFNWFKVTHTFVINTIQKLKDSEMYSKIRTIIHSLKQRLESVRRNKLKHLFVYSVKKNR